MAEAIEVLEWELFKILLSRAGKEPVREDEAATAAADRKDLAKLAEKYSGRLNDLDRTRVKELLATCPMSAP
ncbi:MAG: hypothetical protein AAB758_00450 [Patescibacteria group bacterium]